MPKQDLSILYFAPCGPGEGVGGGARLRNMLDALAQLGAKVRLISYMPAEKSGVAHTRAGGLETTTISVKRSSPTLLKLLALGRVLMYGLGYGRGRGIMLAHAPTVVSGFPALVVARLFRRPLFIDHMDIKDPRTPGLIYRLVLKSSDVVFAISRHLEEEVKELGCCKVVYLPVFVDAGVFRRDTAARARIRQGLGIGDSEIVIGYAGSFSPIEGVPFLLRAFKTLSGRCDNIRLLVVGGGNVPNSDNVAGLINELAIRGKVILVPQQPHELMPQYLSAFDIACSPKIDCAENRAANPIKVYEYMAVGLPMVLSAVGEVANIIEDGVDGFLVKPGDEADLARALEAAVRHPDSARMAGERARDKIINGYTRQVMLAAIEAALRPVKVSETVH